MLVHHQREVTRHVQRTVSGGVSRATFLVWVVIGPSDRCALPESVIPSEVVIVSGSGRSLLDVVLLKSHTARGSKLDTFVGTLICHGSICAPCPLLDRDVNRSISEGSNWSDWLTRTRACRACPARNSTRLRNRCHILIWGRVKQLIVLQLRYISCRLIRNSSIDVRFSALLSLRVLLVEARHGAAVRFHVKDGVLARLYSVEAVITLAFLHDVCRAHSLLQHLTAELARQRPSLPLGRGERSGFLLSCPSLLVKFSFRVISLKCSYRPLSTTCNSVFFSKWKLLFWLKWILLLLFNCVFRDRGTSGDHIKHGVVLAVLFLDHHICSYLIN